MAFAYLRDIHDLNSNIKTCAAMEIHDGCILFVDQRTFAGGNGA